MLSALEWLHIIVEKRIMPVTSHGSLDFEKEFFSLSFPEIELEYSLILEPHQ